MPDKRTELEKALWDKVGPPLYYSENCLLAVKVTARPGEEPLIERPCGNCNCQIIAPRKAMAAGKGGLTAMGRLKVKFWQWSAKLTGRCV